MASINKVVPVHTHGGAKASRVSAKERLERSVMSCLLWENEHYEDGKAIGERITELVGQVSPDDVADIAIRAKSNMKLRHVPLLLTRELMRSKEGRAYAKDLFPQIITRPDDISEFMALYWMNNPAEPIAKQVKVHLGNTFRKFSEYQLQKWSGGQKAVKLRDAMRILRPKPDNDVESALWGRLVKGELKTPDTWEVELSAGKDKKETFERLMAENKLGTLAFLRNLRNMDQAGVPIEVVSEYAATAKVDRIIPFQFISAAKASPRFEAIVEHMMFRCLADQPKLAGKTILVVDTSGSMSSQLSIKSQMSRMDVAASLAILARELCDNPVIYCTAGDDYKRIHATVNVPARRGFALSDYCKYENIYKQIGGGGIFLTQCLESIKEKEKTADRIIVLTDEQDCDTKLNPDKADAFGTHNYIINLASYQNGISYSKFTHISGWSEKVLDYIRVSEMNQVVS